eukprot:scaffold3542_cov54-Phaeocystis_antarctica.AAC.3
MPSVVVLTWVYTQHRAAAQAEMAGCWSAESSADGRWSCRLSAHSCLAGRLLVQVGSIDAAGSHDPPSPSPSHTHLSPALPSLGLCLDARGYYSRRFHVQSFGHVFQVLIKLYGQTIRTGGNTKRNHSPKRRRTSNLRRDGRDCKLEYGFPVLGNSRAKRLLDKDPRAFGAAGDLNTSLPGERSRARLLFCPRTPCPPVGPACPDLRVGAGAQRIRKASCRARRQAELPRLSARLARACASHSPRASRICARRLARRAASLIRGSLERASLPLDGVSLRASASTSARLRLSPA